jgi:hypothetical protein
LSWPNTGISIAENAETCVRTAAIFVLIPEILDRIDASCGLIFGTEILVSSEKINAI